MATVKEWTQKEIEHITASSNLTQRDRQEIEKLKSDLVWFETDERRDVWCVVGGEFVPPGVIFHHLYDVESWMADFEDDVFEDETMTVTTETMTGREVGSLEMFEF